MVYTCAAADLSYWFQRPSGVIIDEEIVDLGSYSLTLTVLSSEALLEDPYEENGRMRERWTPKFAYGR